jgi:hypothetical protein
MRRFHRIPSLAAALVLSLTLAACGTASRPAPAPGVAPAPAAGIGLDRYRFAGRDDARFLAWYGRLAYERAALGLDGVRVLALSGGGAEGAFGAGVLAGWSRRGDRPRFDIVTGVSTGALIAPLAFAGPDWDGRLAAAYHDPAAGRLTRGGPGVLFRPSLFGGKPLADLVARYVDADLLRAVAAEHARGRRLLVATTDLDTQQTVIWDLGAIARDAGRPDDRGRSLRLFRTVLVASASIPGVFPPVFIADGAGPPEMHVDGGIAAPFFILPESMALWRPDPGMRPTELWLLVNGKVGPSVQTTPGAFGPVILRSLDTLTRAQARAQISAARAFAGGSGGRVAVAAVPDAQPADPFDFGPKGMGALYDLGYALAVEGRAFRPADGPDGAR